MKTLFISLMVILLCISHKSYANPKQLKLAVQEYFNTYAQRQDFKKFMSFYAKDATLKDIIYGNDLRNKDEIQSFLNWHNGKFERLGSEHILTVTNQVIENKKAITEGYFHQFKFNGKTFGPWLFVISLEFNEDNKIIKQTDWINYTPRKDFLGGLNMNSEIKK